MQYPVNSVCHRSSHWRILSWRNLRSRVSVISNYSAPNIQTRSRQLCSVHDVACNPRLLTHLLARYGPHSVHLATIQLNPGDFFYGHECRWTTRCSHTWCYHCSWLLQGNNGATYRFESGGESCCTFFTPN
jgi:hypothetical protein